MCKNPLHTSRRSELWNDRGVCLSKSHNAINGWVSLPKLPWLVASTPEDNFLSKRCGSKVTSDLIEGNVILDEITVTGASISIDDMVTTGLLLGFASVWLRNQGAEIVVAPNFLGSGGSFWVVQRQRYLHCIAKQTSWEWEWSEKKKFEKKNKKKTLHRDQFWQDIWNKEHSWPKVYHFPYQLEHDSTLVVILAGSSWSINCIWIWSNTKCKIETKDHIQL